MSKVKLNKKYQKRSVKSKCQCESRTILLYSNYRISYKIYENQVTRLVNETLEIYITNIFIKQSQFLQPII